MPPGKLHFTLHFIGHSDPEGIPAIRDDVKVAASAAGPFPLQLVGLGAFPRAGRARVLWAGVGDGASDLALLASGVRTALGVSGGAPWRAHLTLARAPDPGSDLHEAIEQASGCSWGRQWVERIELIQSDISVRGGPVYTTLAMAPLGKEAIR